MKARLIRLTHWLMFDAQPLLYLIDLMLHVFQVPHGH